MKEMGGVKTRPGLSLSCENIREGMVHKPYVLGKRTTLPFYEKPKACPGVIGIKFEDSIFPYIIDSIFLLCRRTYNPPFYMPRFRCDQTC